MSNLEEPLSVAGGLTLEEMQLRELEGRLRKLREPEGPKGQRQYATGVALVVSFGFVLAGCLYAGVLFGEFLVQRTGSSLMQGVGVLLGLAAAALAGVKLLRPLLVDHG